MPLTLTWSDVAVRLACTVVAGFLVGFDRDERGKPAGIRTNVLVCLAASLSMILANGMLGTSGKNASSFIQLDLMRLPLGILSGMGFIGAGAILRKGEMVLGVTTAATLWMVTMLGICLGAGKILLGTAALVLTLFTLWGLKFVERRLSQEHRGTLCVVTGGEELSRELRGLAKQSGMRVHAWSMDVSRESPRVTVECELRWRAHEREQQEEPALIASLRQRPDIERLRWQS
ncbi:MAG TPA: MgtC/SapB family protein [Acidobacteriaceae bacterium]|jgi:putative Mg2+ transporter-C (MgtC) family protein